MNSEGDSSKPKSKGRAFRGLALVFILTFVNMLGVLVTITALGMEPWGHWQFVGLFGVLEAAAGLSNIVAPNIWRLPVAEMETSKRTPVRLAATTMLIPHWGGAARAAAGIALVIAATVAEGFIVSTLLIVPLIAVLTIGFVGISAVVARLGVAYPHIDTIQFIVRWRGREKELEPLSLSASLQQFALGVLALPSVKVLAPGALYGPEMRPSAEMLVFSTLAMVVLIAATALLWSGRLQWRAPREQQREAELNA